MHACSTKRQPRLCAHDGTRKALEEDGFWKAHPSGQIRWRLHMRSMIQAVCGAGMVLAVSLVGMPASAQEATVHHRVVTQSTHILCGDGTWARYGNPECRGHDGVASRQITTTTTTNPRGSTVVGGYGTNSTVVRGYSNHIRSGAIARCADRTYWHSRRRANACIDHGGVLRWYI
jgi:hypothetical protein